MQHQSSFSTHTRDNPCAICNGHPGLPRGQGIRCAGGVLDVVIYCTREQYAGALPLDGRLSPPAYKHRRYGPCGCGQEHGGGSPPAILDRIPAPKPSRRRAEPITTRDAIYRAALELLTLRPSALADLTRRGLTAAQAHALGYRSIPWRGRELERFLAAMVEQFGEATLRRCPGFTDKNGRLTFWSSVGTRDGYIVPYVDEHGRVTGIQLKVLGGKTQLNCYGTALHAVYNVAGPPGGDLYITEGGTKGKIASHLGGIWTFAIAGQALMSEHIAVIKRLAPGRVIIALDEEENENTDKARERWARDLSTAGFSVYRATWEGEAVGGPKGIDDLIQTGGRPRIRALTLAPAGISTKRNPVPVSEPGPVARGGTLAEVRAHVQRGIHAFLEDRRGNRGCALVVEADPGVGKSRAAITAATRTRATVAYVVGTGDLAAEIAQTAGWELVQGRNAQTCHPDRLPVVQALGAGGFPVGTFACGTPEQPRCPFRTECRYYRQVRGGSRVGTTEQLFNPRFLSGASVLVVDDADLARALVERHAFSGDTLRRAVGHLGPHRGAAQRLLRILRHAVVDAPRNESGRGGPALLNAAAWDHLARTARRNGADIGALVEALPAHGTLPLPLGDEDGVVQVDDVDAVPPHSLLALFAELRAELPAFRRGEDFNSRIRIHPGGIDLWRPRPHATRTNPKPGEAAVMVEEMAMLVLDATPVPVFVDHLTAHHRRLPDVTGRVTLPAGVHVVQVADAGNGHTAQKDERRRQTIAEEVARMRERFPVSDPDREGAIAFKAHRDEWIAAGFAPGRVLTFGRARGTNALEGVERLHILGRPTMPDHEAIYLASVMHRDGSPISPALTLAQRPYGGQPYAVEVVECTDPRVAELFEVGRDGELIQVIHRARLLTLDPQLQLSGMGGAGAGDDTGGRRGVVLVLHSNHPVPGLRVDELVLPGDARDRNTAKAGEAEQRVTAAVQRLAMRGEKVTLDAVTRGARCSKQTAAKYVGTLVHTLKEDSLWGVYQRPQTSSLPSTPAPLPLVPSPPRSTENRCACARGPCVAGHRRCQDCLVEVAVGGARAPTERAAVLASFRAAERAQFPPH
jgi:hypothetical protein